MKKGIATICCLVGLIGWQSSSSLVSTEPDNIIALSSLPSLCNVGPNNSDITAGCLAEEDDGELMMDSEVHRRLTLEADGGFISYGALREDHISCNSGGFSYPCFLAGASSSFYGC